MRNNFDKQLDQLNGELIQMGSYIEKAIGLAVSALMKEDKEKAKEAIAFDAEIDHQEKKIEGLCMKLLLQQQPVARDLRLISSALKMITDMERIGDQAADISEIIMHFSHIPHVKVMEYIQEMAKETTIMVVRSLEAFVNRDLELANEVLAQDDVVDDLFVSVRKELVEWLKENIDHGEEATDLLMIAKYFERIGDHATNIAEWVIFAIKGKHNNAE